jgi:hypothetical protein
MLHQALEEEGGVEYLRWAARKQPVAFLSLIGRLLPAEIRASLDDRSAPIQIRVVTGIEFAPGEKVDDWAAQQRKAAAGPWRWSTWSLTRTTGLRLRPGFP